MRTPLGYAGPQKSWKSRCAAPGTLVARPFRMPKKNPRLLPTPLLDEVWGGRGRPPQPLEDRSVAHLRRRVNGAARRFFEAWSGCPGYSEGAIRAARRGTYMEAKGVARTDKRQTWGSPHPCPESE